MTFMIDLTPEIESCLESEARRHGIDAAEYARKLIEDLLPVQTFRTSRASTGKRRAYRRSIVEIMRGKQSPELFTEPGSVTRYINEERDSWERRSTNDPHY